MKTKFIFIVWFNLILLNCNLYSATGLESTKECSICHYEWLDVFMHQKKSTVIADLPYKRLVATERMCFSCHDGTVVDSRKRVWGYNIHKVGVRPKNINNIPKELPLDEEQKISCRTCHTAHGTGNPKEQSINRSIFLRVKNENGELCKMCHKDKVGHYNHPEKKYINNKEDIILGANGQVICMSCHTPHGSSNEKILLYTLKESKICITCHKDKNITYSKNEMKHPVKLEIKDNFTLMKVIDLNLPLEKNMMTCYTCHTPHKAKGSVLLRETNQYDELCLNCHNDKKTVNYTPHNMKKFQNRILPLIDQTTNGSVCKYCHSPHNWNLKQPENISIDKFSMKCMSCHAINKITDNKTIITDLFSHPVMKEIEGDKNISLPLFTDGNKNRLITCYTCHDTHKKTPGFLRKSIDKNELCLECHQSKKTVLSSKHSKDMNCISCHKIHNSNNKNLVKGNIENSCFNCHKSKGMAEKKLIGEISHPYNITIKDKSKLDKSVKLNNGKLTCTSCHDPHKEGEDGNFLIYDKRSICTKCHNNKTNILESKHDFSDQSKNYCNKCHSIHNAKSKTMIYNFIIKDKNDLCITCHNKEGIAKKDPPKMIHTTNNKNKIKTKFKNESIFCIDCHDPHINGPKKGTEKSFKTSFLKNSDSVCFICHDNINIEKSKHYIGNISIDNKIISLIKKDNDPCGLCHGIHKIKNNYIKDVSFNELCQKCHNIRDMVGDKLIKSSHNSIAINKKIFNKEFDYIICSTCHNPHGSGKNMLQENLDSNSLCKTCHNEKFKIINSPHNVINNKTFICSNCHKPHNFPNKNNYMWPKEIDYKKDYIEEMCKDCHNYKGIADNKTVAFYSHPDIPMTYKADINSIPILYTKSGEKSFNGNITCTTCHDSHIWSEKDLFIINYKTGEDGNALTSFLKYNKVINFCSTCHGKESIYRYKYYHTSKVRNIRNKEKNNIKLNLDFKDKFMILLLGEGAEENK